MAATRLITLHINKGKTLAQSLSDRTDYAANPEKTEKGELVTAYACDPFTVDEDFLLSKRKYEQSVGRQQKHNVIAYQIRQSFKPGEITPEEANRLGHELAMRFTKGRYAFIVATHTDRAHIHNHIVFNSTTIDGSRKFKNFWFSGLALQHLSDMVCLEHGLSVIEPRPYDQREKRTTYPQRPTFRDALCGSMRKIFEKRPATMEQFLQLLEAEGYEIKRGQHLAVRGPGQKRFIRLDSLPEGYRESDLRKLFDSGERTILNPFEKQHRPGYLIDMQEELLQKGPAYLRWSASFNLKQITGAMLYANDHGIRDAEAFEAHVAELTAQRDALLNSVQQAEDRLTEIAALRKHIVNYSKTRPVYEAYRKSGYTRKFLNDHREEIEMHKSAKKAFDALGGKKIPTAKDLGAEFAELLAQKKADYASYHRLSSEVRDARIHQRNYAAMVGMKEDPAIPNPDTRNKSHAR